MAQYRLLADHFVNNVFLPAGSIVSDSGGGAQLPNGWVPTPYCDPQDADGAQKFFNAGVKLPGLIRSHWAGVSIAPPTTRWVPNPNPTGGAGKSLSRVRLDRARRWAGICSDHGRDEQIA